MGVPRDGRMGLTPEYSFREFSTGLNSYPPILSSQTILPIRMSRTIGIRATLEVSQAKRHPQTWTKKNVLLTRLLIVGAVKRPSGVGDSNACFPGRENKCLLIVMFNTLTCVHLSARFKNCLAFDTIKKI